MNKEFCIGCIDDFYNGKNPLDIKECWHFGSAKRIKRRRVGIHERPPWRRTPELLPSCYREKGFIFISPDREN